MTMAAHYSVEIYSGASPLIINSPDILSISSQSNVSALGDELAIDTLEAGFQYNGEPTAIINLPYGTKVQLKIDYTGSGAIVYWGGTFYIETVERTALNNFKIKCISKVGLWDRQYTTGGLFNGTTLANVISSIFNDSEITVDSSVSGIKIYGWIPYGTKRETMQQLLFATGAILYSLMSGYTIRSPYSDGSTIQADDVYMVGSVEYPRKLSKATIVEHGFYYLPGQNPVELFDNLDGYPADNQLVVFPTAPIYIPSVTATDGLTVSSLTVNTCIVSGNGKLTGIPYIHRKFEVVKTNPDASAIDREISVDNATLISIVNSESVAQRVYDYYSQGKNNKLDFKFNNQVCGRRYNFYNVFSELEIGCLSKIRKIYSGFVRASAEFITGFTPTAENTGNRFNNFVVLTTTTSATWYKPANVTKIRIVLIGAGSGGSSGTAGQDGSAEYSGRGGKGGKAGTPGKGGKIFQTTIDNPASSYSYKCGTGGSGGAQCSDTETPNAGATGGETTFGSFSSANGIYSESGFCNILSGIIYALPGGPGVDGGDGGNGGSNSTGIGDDNARNGEDGADVISLAGTLYKGGSGGAGALLQSRRASDKCFGSGGAGGNGACATGSGASGSSGSVVWSWDDGYGEMNISTGGNGHATRSTPSNRASASVYGQGGDAGHGGGGGGAAGAETSDIYWYNTVNYVICSPNGRQENGKGGYGSAGGAGASGCVLIYY